MPHDDIPNMFGRGFESDSDSFFINLNDSYKLVILVGNNFCLTCSECYTKLFVIFLYFLFLFVLLRVPSVQFSLELSMA